MAGRTLIGRARGMLLASAALPLLIALPATAQETPATDAESDIVVTGIRETLQTSISQKKQETAIVDTLSSTEIGDLPALSVGEAIQTITGATTHREKGGASEIALRGLGSFLSNTTFNGREASNGSGDRAVNFNQFPSELINGIKIYKSQQANLVEGGVAGTIELETLKPLDFKSRKLQVEIKGNYSPYQDRITGSDATGYRATLSYVDQFDAGSLGRVGIALGFQRNQTNNPEETVAGSTTWTACKTTVVANANCTALTRAEFAQNPPFYLVPNSITYRQISETDRRDAIFGAVQWQPTSTLEFNADVQYSTREYVENRHDLNISEALFGLTNVVSNADHVVTKLNGLSSLESTNAILSRAEEYIGYGLNGKWRPTDRLTITADGSYSRTIRKEVERNARLRTDPLDVNGTRNFFAPINSTNNSNMRVPYTYEVLPGNFAPTITIDPRFDLNNPALFWDDARMRRDENQRRNRIVAGRVDASYDFSGFLSKISLGGRYVELTYSDYDDRKEFNLNPAMTEDRRINQLCRQGAFPQRDFLSAADGNTISSWATFDGDCLFREYVGGVDPGRNTDVRAVANRDVTEKTWAGYVMGDYRGDLGSLPVRGNFGVRVVNTNVVSNGLRSDLNVVTNPDGTIRLVATGNFQTVTIEDSSTKVLPSVNAVFEPRPDVLIRLAGYRGMSKPAPSALGAGRTITLETTNSTSIADAIAQITANGSPRLKPLMSWNADAAAEYYPNRDTILAATLYYKQFTGGFIPVVLNEDFTIGGQTVSVPVTQTQNSARKSSVYGLEVTAATRFSFLPKPLDGFGGKVSYNYADSDFENEDIRLGDSLDPNTGVVSPGIIPPANLSGYSKHVVSAQLYYQIGGLSLQGVYNYRSKYYQDFVGGNTQLRYVRGNETFDLRASYDISKEARIQFEAVNIFDSPKVTDMPVEGGIRQFHYYGSRYFLGLRVRL